mgnify:CR=1 FL=1|jgi:hypothetical protein
MTVKEFCRNNDLSDDDLRYIEDLLTMGNSFEKVAAKMQLDVNELRVFWEGE